MNTIRNWLLLVCALLLAGCMDIETNVKVSADGSGTVTERVLLTKAALDQMKGMAAAFGGKDGDSGFNLADEKKAKEKAAKMGEGVTVVSVKKVSSPKGEGAEVVYAFKDINKLKLSEDPASSMPQAPGDAAPAGKKEDMVAFSFTKGTPATLVIKTSGITPDKKKDGAVKETAGKESEEASADADEMAQQMMKEMFTDMRVKMSVQFAGNIVNTNAQHHTNTEVTLMEMDFKKLMANPEKFKKVMKANPQSMEEAKALLGGIDGIKMETSPELKVTFQ